MDEDSESSIDEKILIAAVAEDGTIGKNGDIPWHFPADLKRFKQLTTGNPIIMGDNTYRSLPDGHRPLPDRTNIVLTRDQEPGFAGEVEVANSIEEAWEIARNHSDGKAYIGGGASIYSQMMEDADKLEITRVHETYDGDTFFPEVDWDNWNLVNKTEKNEKLTFLTYERAS